MGNAIYNVSDQYGKKGSPQYAVEYETEQDTPRHFWQRLNVALKTRYKIMTDENARKKHQTQMVRQRLKEVGLSSLDLIKPEAFYLTTLLKTNEKIRAAICGRIEGGSSAYFVLTDSRMLYINVIPFFTTIEEIGFGVIEAVSIGIGRFEASVSLYTGIGNFTANRVSLGAASRFVEAVEAVIEANQVVVK